MSSRALKIEPTERRTNEIKAYLLFLHDQWGAFDD